MLKLWIVVFIYSFVCAPTWAQSFENVGGPGFYKFKTTDESDVQIHVASEEPSSVGSNTQTILDDHPADISPGFEDLNSEVVGNVPVPTERPKEEQNVPVPQPRPQTPRAEAPAVVESPSEGQFKVFDMKGCTYGKMFTPNIHCYTRMRTPERASRILRAVKYVNDLHQTNFDGRYMLCTGWRETRFNPHWIGGSGEHGMFQVMPGTAKAALRYGVEIPEFKSYNSQTYTQKMINSTVAQVELSFLTLKMKLTEWTSGQSQSEKRKVMAIMSGSDSEELYRGLARRYNGAGPAAERYANAIKSCYACMKTKISANEMSISAPIQPCLDKATPGGK